MECALKHSGIGVVTTLYMHTHTHTAKKERRREGVYEKCEDKDHLCKAAAEQKRFIPPLRTTFYSFIIKPETMQIKNASFILLRCQM